MKNQLADTGVIVGRFQVDDLHEGHKGVFDTVMAAHERVIVFLGLNPTKCTRTNPLDFESRKRMINKHYKDVTVLYIKDVKSDELWSSTLDEQIETLIGPDHKACLYGGRDSFIQHYTGKFETQEFRQEVFISGTAIRKKLAIQSKGTTDFNSGVIWATLNQYPSALPTVDIAIFNADRSEILLGRKHYEKEYRFIGGFVNPGETYEEAAQRETKEESNLSIVKPTYIGSFAVDDWRYRRETNKITTAFFESTKFSGDPAPGDDIEEVRWFKFNGEVMGLLVDNHKILMEALLVRRA